MRLPVVRFEQNDHIFYQGVASAGELVNTARVDEWCISKTSDEQGYQRKPLASHYNKIAKYLVNEQQDATLPTTVLLNLRVKGKFTKIKQIGAGVLGILQLSSEDLKDLYIVDGQHRVYGLKAAIENWGEEQYKNFPVPITIMESAKKIDEVRQFHIINTTSRKVATDLSERLLKELAAKDPVAADNLKKQGKDWKLKAMDIVDILNTKEGSMWYDKIQKPNEPRVGSITISQTSFVESLKPLLTPGGFLSQYSVQSAAELINRFWKAVSNLVPEAFEYPKDFSIQKTAGVFSLHLVAPDIFQFCQNDLDVQCIEGILANAREIFTTDFWCTGGDAGLYSSKSGNRMLANMIKEYLPSMEKELEL